MQETVGTHDGEAGSSRPKRTRQHETVKEAMLPHVYHEVLIWAKINRAAKSKYNTNLARLKPKQIYSLVIMDWGVLNNMGCAEEIEAMLQIKVYEVGGQEEIFSSEAWRRVFDINEPIYTKLCHEFYSTYEFDEVVMDDELMTKKLIKFRLGVYFRGGLHSDENARDYWLSISSEEELNLSRSLASSIRTYLMARWLKRKGVGSQRDSMICYGQLITKIEKKMSLLTDEVLNSLSAPTNCRASDATILRELIGSNGRLIAKNPAPGVPRVAMPRNPRLSMQDLYDRMGNMEIRQGVLERMARRHAYQFDRYARVFEYMARKHGIPL
ncbi:hypothetical protein Tco_0017910 [Tanacetum coccineum]